MRALQPNSLEYERALAWRRLHLYVRAAKHEMRGGHANRLAQLMQAYLQVLGLIKAYPR